MAVKDSLLRAEWHRFCHSTHLDLFCLQTGNGSSFG